MLTEFDSLVEALVRTGVPRAKAEASARAKLGTSSEAPATPTRDERVLEKAEQAEVVKRFRAFGFKVYNLSQARATKQTPGLADLWCAHTRHPIAFWWETKRQVGGEHSPAQIDFRAECYRCCVGYGTGDRYAADEHLILLGLAIRLADGTLHPAPGDPIPTPFLV